ncbi:hypothetical protein CMI48_02080 [Candidatus Pacearchaeota archaeon]|nr:hypothetical protein [Candidatus Pacearchaeota archaeon]
MGVVNVGVFGGLVLRVGVRERGARGAEPPGYFNFCRSVKYLNLWKLVAFETFTSPRICHVLRT